MKLTCSGETGTAVVSETVDPDFVEAGEEPFWSPCTRQRTWMLRFELEWLKILPQLHVVIGYTTDFSTLDGVLDRRARQKRCVETKSHALETCPQQGRS